MRINQWCIQISYMCEWLIDIQFPFFAKCTLHALLYTLAFERDLRTYFEQTVQGTLRALPSIAFDVWVHTCFQVSISCLKPYHQRWVLLRRVCAMCYITISYLYRFTPILKILLEDLVFVECIEWRKALFSIYARCIRSVSESASHGEGICYVKCWSVWCVSSIFVHVCSC